MANPHGECAQDRRSQLVMICTHQLSPGTTDSGAGNLLISTEGLDHSEDSAVRISDQ